MPDSLEANVGLTGPGEGGPAEGGLSSQHLPTENPLFLPAH